MSDLTATAEDAALEVASWINAISDGEITNNDIEALTDILFDAFSDYGWDRFNAGQESGYDDGERDGYSRGYEDGLYQGEATGYNRGYQEAKYDVQAALGF